MKIFEPEIFWLKGKVAHGYANGRTFGYPTANLTDIQPVMPFTTGVYAAWVQYGGRQYGAMMYVGTRPTLALTETTVEIHIFDFQQDIYGKEIEFAVIKKIREEKRFESVDALTAQLQEDEQTIRGLMNDE
ncbi:MAG: riboflavin kinase [Bacteroidales bacterium]|nr:riboflavin kinase [Bacteroidales bacterium]MDD6582827.1 riboflavin kinase [Bacteroidales bacterium]